MFKSQLTETAVAVVVQNEALSAVALVHVVVDVEAVLITGVAILTPT